MRLGKDPVGEPTLKGPLLNLFNYFAQSNLGYIFNDRRKERLERLHLLWWNNFKRKRRPKRPKKPLKPRKKIRLKQ